MEKKMNQVFDFQPLVNAVIDGEGDDAVEIVKKALDAQVGIDEIIESGLVKGMKVVSDKYDTKEFFVPDLAAAADAMSQALELLNPLLRKRGEDNKGTIVIGVVKECSQEIGKNIVAAILSGAGYNVYDLGINVSPERFVEKAKEVNADIIAMGSPMLQTVKYFKEVHELLLAGSMRDRVKLLIGGASTTAQTVGEVNADAWGKDGPDAVLKADTLMKNAKHKEALK